MGVLSSEVSSDVSMEMKSLTDNGASENSLLAPSGDQDNSIFAMNKIANGFSIGDIASFSPSNMPFPPCQILTNFPGTSDQRPSEFGRSRGSRKEKKRTECINNAFSQLRRRIPNVPMDTKLSKIKTLRLATSYIAYLTDIVQSADPSDERDGRDFRADLKALRTRERRRQLCQTATSHMSCNENGADLLSSTVSRCNRAATDSPSQHKVKKKNKGRTGWPEAVWAMELGNITPRGGFQIPTPETTISQEEYRNCYSRNGNNGPVISGVYSLHHLAKDGQQPSCDGTSDQMRQINTIVPYNFKIESPMLSNPTLCHVGQYTGNEDTIPYFPYPPLPLPGASSFSKKLPSIPLFVPEIREFHHNGHSTQVEPFLGSRAVEQDQDVGVHQATGQSTFATVSAMPDIRVHQNEQSNDPMGQSVLGNTPIISEIHEERRNGDLPMYIFDKDATLTGPSFVELKTVSAASIRISTSTINGLATFTTTGRPEMQCFGATRVAESGSRS